MTIARRVFISGPRETYLDARTKELRSAILDEVTKLRYELTAFGTAEGGLGVAAGTTWSRAAAITVMHRCVAAVLLGFPYWRSSRDDVEVSLATEYCQYEGALADTLGLPILALLESGTDERVAFHPHGGDPVLSIPKDATTDWVGSDEFQDFLAGWDTRLKQRRDVFLGYSSSSGKIAETIKAHLKKEEVSVLDWNTDFDVAGSILSEIKEAAARCSGGIFLFTGDDRVESESGEMAVPRDNVLFEAGYFTHAKGKERVLIILETGIELPADLGGDIYVPFAHDDTKAMLAGVSRFVRGRL